MVEVQENYKNYTSPKVALKSIKRMIRYTQKEFFTGLDYINLTNTDALNRKYRRKKTKSRKRKVSLNNCEGWYVEKWGDQPAHIDLLIDNIYFDYPNWLLRVGFISDIALSPTFFHELGHHIHKTQKPEHDEREDVANRWGSRLSKQYFWKRYWHIMILILPLKPLFDWLLKRYDDKIKLTSPSA